jgi:hypothetical protein
MLFARNILHAQGKQASEFRLNVQGTRCFVADTTVIDGIQALSPHMRSCSLLQLHTKVVSQDHIAMTMKAGANAPLSFTVHSFTHTFRESAAPAHLIGQNSHVPTTSHAPPAH